MGLAYSSHNANKKLLTACQHWNHDITCLSDWAIYRRHILTVTVMLSKLVMWPVHPTAGGKIAPGVYILPHTAKKTLLVSQSQSAFTWF